MTTAHDQVLPHEADHERTARRDLAALLATPIPQPEFADNLSLYRYGETLRDVLAMDLLYRQISDVPGVIFEFGVHRGRHMAPGLRQVQVGLAEHDRLRRAQRRVVEGGEERLQVLYPLPQPPDGGQERPGLGEADHDTLGDADGVTCTA